VFSINNTSVFNLSNIHLSSDQSIVLGLGLSFLPKYAWKPILIKESIISSINDFKNRIYRGIVYRGRTYIPNDIPSISLRPPISSNEDWTKEVDKYINQCKQSVNDLQISSHISSVYKYLHAVIKSLKDNDQIIIKPADKNLGTCVMSKIDYIVMCMVHLSDPNTYQQVNSIPYNQSYHDLAKILYEHKRLYISYKRKVGEEQPQYSYLAQSLSQLMNTPKLRPCKFYCLPKVHKKTLAGRPIASSINTMTYHASKYLHNIFWPIVNRLQTICTSSLEFMLDIEDLYIPDGSVILTADVKSLYPSIPIEYGIMMFNNVLISLNLLPNDRSFLLDLLKWVLQNNFLEFNGNLYRQIKGTAMGTPVAVAYANIVLHGMERDILYDVVFYRRYVDDVFAIFRSQESAQQFINAFNSICSSIQFEECHIGDSGIFLDYQLSIHQNRLVSNLYQKPMNKYLYLPPTSAHKIHIMKSVIRREIFRYRLYCSNDSDFMKILVQFRIRLIDRGYQRTYLDPCFSNLPSRQQCLESIREIRKRKSVGKSIPLIITLKIPSMQSSIKLSEILRLPESLESLPEFAEAFPSKRVVIGSQNLASIGYTLVHRPLSCSSSVAQVSVGVDGSCTTQHHNENNDVGDSNASLESNSKNMEHGT
jgi:hypothetical protein